MRFVAFSTALTLWATTCGPEFHYQTLDADISAYCHNAWNCESGTDELIAKCENELHDHGDDALEESGDCAEGFSILLRCISDLDCKESTAWGINRTSPHDDVIYPCKSENVRFLANCDSTWYSAPQQEGS